jgi:hypothetical protein
VAAFTTGECDLKETNGIEWRPRNALVLLPKGAYLGTRKHYSVVRAQHVSDSIARLLQRVKAASPSQLKRGVLRGP